MHHGSFSHKTRDKQLALHSYRHLVLLSLGAFCTLYALSKRVLLPIIPSCPCSSTFAVLEMNHALHAAFETHSCFKEKAKPSPMLLNFPLHSIREPDVDLCQARQTALSSRHRTPLSSKEPHQHWDMDLFFCSTFCAQSTSWALGEQRGKGQANCFNPGRLTQILVWRCQRQLMTHATKARERECCKF